MAEYAMPICVGDLHAGDAKYCVSTVFPRSVGYYVAIRLTPPAPLSCGKRGDIAESCLFYSLLCLFLNPLCEVERVEQRSAFGVSPLATQKIPQTRSIG